MTLINESQEELRFQVSASEWSQKNGSGEMVLTPTTDLVFFPALLTLKPGEERKVRVGTTQPVGPVEKTYRIFFEELPALSTPQTKATAEVRIITKLGVPIFVQPQKSQPGGAITNMALNGGKLTFDIQNTGNVHFMVRSVKVLAMDTDGKRVFEKEREGWYVLRSGSRQYDLDVTPAECAATKTLRVDISTDLPAAKPEDAVVSKEIQVPPGACK